MLRRMEEWNVDRIKQIERRIDKIKKDLAMVEDMRPGSLSIQARSWGGEYGQLSYTHQGKGRTEYVPKDKHKAVKKQLANYAKFKKLTQEWVNLGIELCKLNLRPEDKK